MPGVHEGYEPNPLALRVFALWGLMERSRSVPVGRSPGALDNGVFHGALNDGGFQVNPFYSEKVKENMALRAARPRQLPPTPVVESEGAISGRGVTLDQWGGPTGEKPGKGRGAIGSGRGDFLTPPSNWKSLEPSSAAPVMGARTEGVMPAVSEERPLSSWWSSA